jgi:hypothetical protein
MNAGTTRLHRLYRAKTRGLSAERRVPFRAWLRAVARGVCEEAYPGHQADARTCCRRKWPAPRSTFACGGPAAPACPCCRSRPCDGSRLGCAKRETRWAAA